ncbi:MAG TPA: aspartate--ammonia ligase [Firmicutes bacterium]|nr:aspartate--ammonia ligase [Bacillota bacterium]
MNGEVKGLIVPEGYKSPLDLRDTVIAIKLIKDFFENRLARELNLVRVSAPLFVRPESGLNDNLNGVERPVVFDVKGIDGNTVEIVHSLAKWKRLALKRYGFDSQEGLYTDMNAIRRDEDLDNMHSVYVDQWDWEKIILPENRNLDYLKGTVMDIVGAVCDTQNTLLAIYPQLSSVGELSREVSFITAQQLEDMYPALTPKERENEYTKEHHTVFIIGIGAPLKSGRPHDGRAPDYDDWSLNGDLILWYGLLEKAVEMSSMGIRVDAVSLRQQVDDLGCTDRLALTYHRDLLAGKLPYTIGGGIGQSRLCMYFLQKAHIGEVQASAWPEGMINACREAEIFLL